MDYNGHGRLDVTYVEKTYDNNLWKSWVFTAIMLFLWTTVYDTLSGNSVEDVYVYSTNNALT